MAMSIATQRKIIEIRCKCTNRIRIAFYFLRIGTPDLYVSEMAEKLILEFCLLYHLMSANYETLSAQKGIGKSKFSQIQVILELINLYFYSNLLYDNMMLNSQIPKIFAQAAFLSG